MAAKRLLTASPIRRRKATEISEWVETLSPEQLLCRDLGHTWTPYRAWRDVSNHEYVQVLRCNRCHAERQRHLDFRGQRVSQSYSYEDGYLAPKGSGAFTASGRAELRLISIERLVADTNAMDAATDERKAG